MFKDKGPTLETVLRQENYRPRWKTILHMQMVGGLDRALMEELKELAEDTKCWACTCNSHEATECMFVNFVMTGHPFSCHRNMYNNETFYAVDNTKK